MYKIVHKIVYKFPPPLSDTHSHPHPPRPPTTRPTTAPVNLSTSGPRYSMAGLTKGDKPPLYNRVSSSETYSCFVK